MWRATSSASHSVCDSRAYRYAGVSLASAGVLRCPDELEEAAALRRTGRFVGREAPGTDRSVAGAAAAESSAVAATVEADPPAVAAVASDAGVARTATSRRGFVSSASAIAAASASTTTR